MEPVASIVHTVHTTSFGLSSGCISRCTHRKFWSARVCIFFLIVAYKQELLSCRGTQDALNIAREQRKPIVDWLVRLQYLRNPAPLFLFHVITVARTGEGRFGFVADGRWSWHVDVAG